MSRSSPFSRETRCVSIFLFNRWFTYYLVIKKYYLTVPRSMLIYRMEQKHNAGLHFRSVATWPRLVNHRRRSVDVVSTRRHGCVVSPMRRKPLEPTQANIVWYWRQWVGLDRWSKAIFWPTNPKIYLVTASCRRESSPFPPKPWPQLYPMLTDCYG